MSDESFWSRVRKGRLFQVLAVYVGASWIVLQVVGELRIALELPRWVAPVSLLLLAVGLVVILATAWVQAHPLVERREAADEVPGSWELGIDEIGDALRSGKLPHLTWTRALVAGVFAFSLLFGAAGVYVVVQDRGRSFEPPAAVASEDAAPAVAVLPFTVRGEGLEVWREGMVEALSSNLDGAGGLRAVDSRTVLARWHENVGEGDSPDLSTALGAARAAGARWALVGSVIGGSGGLRLTADVYDLVSGEVIGDGQVEGAPEEIFRLVDGLSIEVLRALQSDPSPGSSFDLARITTRSVEALRAYLEGLALLRRGAFEDAIPRFERAVAEDSTFALAHYRLSQAHGWAGGTGSPARREALQRALRHGDRLPRRESLLLRARRAVGAGDLSYVDSLERAVRRYPDDAEAWYLLGEVRLHGAGPRIPSNLEEVAEAFRHAVELDPNFTPYLIHWFDMAAWHEPDSAEAARRLDQLRRAGADARVLRPKQLTFDLTFGDSATRAARLAALDTIPRGAKITSISEGLYNPRHASLREAVLRSVLDDTRGENKLRWVRYLFQNLAFGQGRIEAGLEVLEDPLVPHGPRRFCELWRAAAMGLPVSAGVLEAAREGAPLEEGVNPCVYVGRAEWAIERGDRGERARAVELLRKAAEAYLARASADSAEAANVRAMLQGSLRALDGYAAWREGDPDGAARLLEEAQRALPSDEARWWLARIHLERDRPARAVRWLRSFWWDEHTLARYHLGRAYEAVGEPERAREAYRAFVEGWSEADPALQPRVEEARDALARLDVGSGAG